ncbi:MAG TPA: DUF2971 domain-containing protein [Candidatus Hydrogenedentes bacterium]|nr:DUF2971 domain-containing protein [Candidatus Hydrogenedentota bacterium]
MQDYQILRPLRDQLCNDLLSLTLEFGPTFPVKQEEVDKSRIVGASDFSSCYPDLDVLCHYTNATGLEGIINSGTFWATNVACLNDPKEFRFAYEAFEGMISQGDYALDRTLVGAFLNGLQTGGHDYEVERTFIISFSSRRDDLSQFRLYSDDACGYALEFKPCELINALNNYLEHSSGEYFTLRRVRYGEAELAPFHARAISALKSCINQLPYPVSSGKFLSAVRAFGMDFQEYLREAGVFFKQAGYKDEEEYRVILDVPGLLFVLPTYLDDKRAVRNKGKLSLTYIPFQFLPDPKEQGCFVNHDNSAGLARIVVGPGLDFNLAQKELDCLLRRKELHKVVNIQHSQHLYRSLRV